jgi:hypothetical protein
MLHDGYPACEDEASKRQQSILIKELFVIYREWYRNEKIAGIFEFLEMASSGGTVLYQTAAEKNVYSGFKQDQLYDPAK